MFTAFVLYEYNYKIRYQVCGPQSVIDIPYMFGIPTFYDKFHYNELTKQKACQILWCSM